LGQISAYMSARGRGSSTSERRLSALAVASGDGFLLVLVGPFLRLAEPFQCLTKPFLRSIDPVLRFVDLNLRLGDFLRTILDLSLGLNDLPVCAAAALRPGDALLLPGPRGPDSRHYAPDARQCWQLTPARSQAATLNERRGTRRPTGALSATTGGGPPGTVCPAPSRRRSARPLDGQLLLRGCLQSAQFGVVVREPMSGDPRRKGLCDLHSVGARGRPHAAHVQYQSPCDPGLVRKSTRHERQTSRSAGRRVPQGRNMAQVG